jgi:phosphopantothenoylcysteine synthetase/decarboxylase
MNKLLKNKKIILIIGGGIAAYKSLVFLISELNKETYKQQFLHQ